MRRLRFAPWALALASFLSFTAIFGGLAAARPHVSERWALYLGSPAHPEHSRLFLDPFPSLATCLTRVKVFEDNLEQAYCASHDRWEFGDAEDGVLAADFNPLHPETWFCPRPVKRTKRAAPAA